MSVIRLLLRALVVFNRPVTVDSLARRLREHPELVALWIGKLEHYGLVERSMTRRYPVGETVAFAITEKAVHQLRYHDERQMDRITKRPPFVRAICTRRGK